MSVQIHTIVWRGITVRITHHPDRFSCSFDHLEIQSVAPDRAALPITETGYKSHFLHANELASYGGPVAFVTAWLDHDAHSSAWQEAELSSRQLSLF